MLSFFSHIWLFVTPWIIAHQAPLPIGFSRQEYCSGLPLPSPVCTHTHTHTHTHTSFLNTLFHYDLSQDIEHCSLCYTVGPCCSSILNIKAFNCSPQLLTAPRNSSPLGNQTSLLVLLVIWWLVTNNNKQVLPSLHRWWLQHLGSFPAPAWQSCTLPRALPPSTVW